MFKIFSNILLFVLVSNFFTSFSFCNPRIVTFKSSIGDLSFFLLKDFASVENLFRDNKCGAGYIDKIDNNSIVFSFENPNCKVKKPSKNNIKKYTSNVGALFLNKSNQMEIITSKIKGGLFDSNDYFIIAHATDKTLKKILKNFNLSPDNNTASNNKDSQGHGRGKIKFFDVKILMKDVKKNKTN